MILFAASLSQRQYSYVSWKTAWNLRGGSPQCDGDNGSYWILWFYDGMEVHMTQVWMSTLPDDVAANYTGGQTQATADLTDFTTNVQPSCNGVLAPKAADGRPDYRMTAANKARNFSLRIFSFDSGNPLSLVNQDSSYNSLTDITMTCYDASGVLTTDPTVAVKSVLDLEPHFNYEVIGGWIDTPTSILGGTTGEWWISCVGLPDIPSAYGGSVNFVYPANLEIVYTQKIVSDGRASQYLTYNGTYHTNKVRWIMKHPPNIGASVQIYLETFV